MTKKRVPPNFPMNFRATRKQITAKRARLRPYGLTWIMALERRVEKMCAEPQP